MRIAQVNIESRVAKAIAWLDSTMLADGSVKRYLYTPTGEYGTVSTEITGYEAHLFAWLGFTLGKTEYAVRAQKHADWIVQLWQKNNSNFLPFEPGSEHSYFFDNGIAVRGLLMTYELTKQKIYRQVAKEIVDFMKLFWDGGEYTPIVNKALQYAGPKERRWSSSAHAHQMKATLPFLYFNRTWEWDNFPKGMMLTGEPHTDGDLLHPLAYFIEGLAMSKLPVRAAFWLDMLNAELRKQRINSGSLGAGKEGLWRCDAVAQTARLRMHLNCDLGAIIQHIAMMQCENGGFWFARKDGAAVPYLSTHATIFAIQAMQMSLERIPVDYGVLTLI